jgi:hypothetical protein
MNRGQRLASMLTSAILERKISTGKGGHEQRENRRGGRTAVFQS